MNIEHRSWDSEWADIQNTPEWPMWGVALLIGALMLSVMWVFDIQ